LAESAATGKTLAEVAPWRNGIGPANSRSDLHPNSPWWAGCPYRRKTLVLVAPETKPARKY
jgi:hypothetical protein